ncbi:MAG TPA: hypothetical protein VFJ10_14670, partial [Acidobacteriaceae bacterium]|nr:hypothetical protein [Acidobacteriaceae bacterium]
DAGVAIRVATGRPTRPSTHCSHTPAENFRPGERLSVVLEIPPTAGEVVPRSIRLWYRHVDQAERWTSAEMSGDGGRYAGAIPAEYTDSRYALEYYFELRDENGVAWMCPGFNQTLSNRPYFTVSRAKA